MDVRTTLRQFDEYLAKRGVNLEAVVIGGAALNIMGIITRDTVDVDCLDPQIPEGILALVRRHFSILKKRLGYAQK